jgi:hypothetical protein
VTFICIWPKLTKKSKEPRHKEKMMTETCARCGRKAKGDVSEHSLGVGNGCLLFARRYLFVGHPFSFAIALTETSG